MSIVLYAGAGAAQPTSTTAMAQPRATCRVPETKPPPAVEGAPPACGVLCDRCLLFCFFYIFFFFLLISCSVGVARFLVSERKTSTFFFLDGVWSGSEYRVF